MTPAHEDWAAMPREVAVPRLLDQHGGRLYALGRRLCGNDAEAEDLVQETFLRAWKGWDTFQGRANPATWLWTIAARACQRMHRRRAGEPQRMASLAELLPFGARTLATTGDGLDREAHAEAVRNVEAAILELPVAFRLPLVLKEIVGFEVSEVAEILGLVPATVKTRLYRARLKLRDAVERGLPRRELPPAAYSRQVCLDLLHAKQEALDRGAKMPDDVICERCLAVFATLDLAHDACAALGEGRLPRAVRELVMRELEAAG